MGKRINMAGIEISHPDRVVYPAIGMTKGQVAQYYEAAAGRMLQSCKNRPLSLLRLPEGLAGERFFQKHAQRGFPEDIGRMSIRQSDGTTRGSYMYVDKAAGLVAAAQMGTLEFHIWGATRDRLERPDRMVFDLDPDEAIRWEHVARAALSLRDRLEAFDLPAWPMVTGGKGVHVVVPLRRIAEWETVTHYARTFATMLAEEAPERFTAQMAKSKRKGRIFIDWLRNERGATAIAPFSLRARENAPVAVPVAWSELAALGSADIFSPEAALDRSWSDCPVPHAVGLSRARVEKLAESSLR
ncbi:hypothetical protein D6851_12695 [Altericroceibacterium spongiae]|uniref:DNA ligase D polymerase domain-containing protein n=1 Tax=Altericroceibacterium spongiae TaxID=2320269 RepID=A0A420EF36_9SPHN|nr:non-homologous end-joining DNA ligase [Altericroceibacterium spongiae]RKF19311.1 hypothetical protein D6851_12695 [Altericroceibacterium spongiae]